MKRKNFALLFAVLFAGVLCFSGCSTQKNYDMSFEQVISLLENQSREMMEMFFNFDAQEKDVNLATKVNTDDIDLALNVLSQVKVDYDSKVQDTAISFDADVKIPESKLDFSTSGAVNYSLIWDNIFFKLSEFSFGWPSANDLAMVNMIVNGFKWQRFKLGMSGMSMSKTFDLYDLYSERLWELVDNAWDAMINQWSGIYDWIFDEYKWYNAWKYSVDEEKIDEMLKLYADMMNEFYSWLFAQYAAQNLWDEETNIIDFNSLLSGIKYDNLQWYFVIVWKNEVVETMEGAHMDIDGTWMVFNYYYWKDWLYMDVKTDNWDSIMSILAKKNGKKYDVDADILSVFKIKWDVKLNQFSKKDWIDADFDLNISMNTEEFVESDGSIKEINIDMPLKWNYKVKNINKFSLQEPSEAIDLMEMLWGYLWASMGGDDEYREDDEYEYWDDEEYEVADVEVEG